MCGTLVNTGIMWQHVGCCFNTIVIINTFILSRIKYSIKMSLQVLRNVAV